MVENPKVHGFYGSQVAGPIFKGIAEGIFESEMDLHVALNQRGMPRRVSSKIRGRHVGSKSDFKEIFNNLKIPYTDNIDDNKWVQLQPRSDSLNLYPKLFSEELVPNVIGMGLKDALHLLESRGLKVKTSGVGKVRLQSIKSGTPVKGQNIWLTLK